MKIVVIGGTGLIGSQTVEILREHGHEVAPASPGTGVNALTGEGLAEALAGADVVVDVSNSPSFERDAVLDFFRTSTTNVLAAEKEAGVGHHVALSIVGTRRTAGNDYFRAKAAQEELIESSPVPWTIVHATQFFEFLPAIADDATVDGVVRVAPVGFQPVASADVARAVARAAAHDPVNGHVEVGGPGRFRFDELIRDVLKNAGDPREVVTDPQATYFGSGLEEDSLVPVGGSASLGEITLAEWRASRAAS